MTRPARLKALSLLLILSLLLPLSACQSKADKMDKIAEGKYTDLLFDGDSYYLYLKKDTPPRLSFAIPVSAAIEQPYFLLESIEELKHKILFGDFTYDEFMTMTLSFVSSGNLVKICNPFTLVEPTYPDYFSDYTVRWSFTSYFYLFKRNDDAEKYHRMYMVSESSFASGRIRDTEMPENYTQKDYCLAEDDNGRKVETWYEKDYGRSIKRVSYTLKSNEKTAYVIEYSFQYDKETSFTQQQNYTQIYVQDGDRYLDIYIEHGDAPLNEEEILQFGVREYVETETK